MNDIQIFNNPEFGSVRTIEEDGKVFFSGSDVARVLGYSNPRAAIQRHCMHSGVLKRDGVSLTTNQHGITSEQTTEMTFISESNVYRLITHSKLPSAMRFEKWVFDTVLPSIRRHGLFAVDEMLNNPDMLINALTKLKEERKRAAELESQTAQQALLIGEMQPKADYCDLVLQSPSLLPISQIAKDYGMSAIAMNQKLKELGVQYSRAGVWMLYQKYADKGYTQTKTHVFSEDHAKLHTYWTQQGRLFIYELLKSKCGILPVMERSAA